MSFDQLRRRLDRIERSEGTGLHGFGRLPALEIITTSPKDRDRQLAALTAAGEYQPNRLLIEWRIVKPYPEMEALDRELRRSVPPSGPH